MLDEQKRKLDEIIARMEESGVAWENGDLPDGYQEALGQIQDGTLIDSFEEVVSTRYAKRLGNIMSGIFQKDGQPMSQQESDMIVMAGALINMEQALMDIQKAVEQTNKEIVFNSSANRFAHLRNNVDRAATGDSMGLPPAPDWNVLAAYVEPMLQKAIDHIKGAPVLKDRAAVSGMLPLDVLKGVDVVGEELLRIVTERGKTYGEEAILAMGEAGLISMIMAKVMRLLWSHRAGHWFSYREDSYIDLAGYCLLTISLDRYIRENSNNGTKDSVSGGASPDDRTNIGNVDTEAA